MDYWIDCLMDSVPAGLMAMIILGGWIDRPLDHVIDGFLDGMFDG
jgi:hypothetical protein